MEIFVLTFKAYGPNAVRSMHLECQNKYFPYGPKSRLIKALLCTYTNKMVYDKVLLRSLFIVIRSIRLSANQIKEFVPYFNQYTITLNI